MSTAAFAVKGAKRAKARDALIPKRYWVDAKDLPPADQKSVIDLVSPLLSKKEIDIISILDVTALLKRLHSAELSAVEVLEAYTKQAIFTQQLVGVLTETMIPEAFENAQALDKILAETGKPVGPLHGLPISLKDQFHIKGYELNIGYVSRIGTVSDRHCTLVDLLVKAGAVYYVRTNLPQNIMRGEVDNFVYGLTTNPSNRELSPGGSTGGEGALLAMHGSPLGVGTDIGGSVRIPAAFCGIWSLRPSYHRVPYQWCANSMLGQETVPSVIGPMSSSYTGLVEFMKAIASQEPWLHDPIVLEKPWNEAAFEAPQKKGKLTFAMMWDDGVTRVHPPITRAQKAVVAALTAAGHEIIDWSPVNHVEGTAILDVVYKADGGKDIADECAASGEPILPGLGEGASKHLTVWEAWQLNKRRDAFRKTYLDAWNASASKTANGLPVDAIISPVAPFVAAVLTENDNLDYTSIWNLLDYPSVVFPTGLRVDVGIDTGKVAGEAISGSRDELNASRWEEHGAVGYENAPVGLQVLGRRGREEEILGIAKVLGKAIEQI
ncbi:general amidase [Exophiala viscosa]|uniref:General amidase n=1 Tax=Exophiala viscosa TaxID=2486360 RepID=A0AAN6DLD6_9EURO|nr:general amidase [Exophiala viscosa]KAI1620039.1 general amidase [Exophiala viscosa]